MSAVVRVLKAGMLTTIQDLGRWGFQAEGVPVSGPMDPLAHRTANALVGNPRTAATLEVTLLGPELEVGDDREVAIAGAEFDVTLDNRSVDPNGAFSAPAGSRLRFGLRRRGARAYVAFAGGIATPTTLGSRATHLLGAMGGMGGRALRAGDVIPLGTVARRSSARQRDSGVRRRLPSSPARIRVMAGPQEDYFAADALAVLQSGPYVITNTSDRMGFRLDGPSIKHARGADIISDATPLGVLQVPASGQPILLMADRQTAGGYPKLATVISADIPIAGQLGPGDAIAFEVCSLAEAMSALIAQERLVMTLEGPAA